MNDPMTDTAGPVQVTRADREAAASVCTKKHLRDAILMGRLDDASTVQAFAHHRLNTRAASNGEWADALAKVIHTNGPVVVDFMGDGIAWRPLDYGTWTALAASSYPASAGDETRDNGQSQRIYREWPVYRSEIENDHFAKNWPDWLKGRVAILGYAEQGFRVCAQPGGADVGNGAWGDLIVEYADGSLSVRAPSATPAQEVDETERRNENERSRHADPRP